MADKKYESLKIENIVASGVIADSINLVDVSGKIKDCELNTKRFPGAVYRIENPKIAWLIFIRKSCSDQWWIKKHFRMDFG